jgi:predicted metal-dependent phosphotriesterase family hydrolase
MSSRRLAGGATLFHEHLSFSTEFATKLASTPFPGVPGEKYFLEDPDLMTEELAAAKKDGVACLVNGGHADMGRSLRACRLWTILRA